MDWLSILILIVIGALTFSAYRNGVIRELVSLCALILAIPIAGLFYDDLANNLVTIVDNQRAAQLISFLSMLVGVMLLGQIASSLLRSMVDLLNLGWADSWAGALFGFAKGVLVAQAFLIAFIAFPKPDFRDEIDKSPVASGLVDATPTVLALLPRGFESAVHRFQDGIANLPVPDSEPTPTETP